MNLLYILDYFIKAEEAELSDLEWQIREETNYEDCDLDYLSESYDCVQERLEGLKKIKKLLIQHNLIGEK